MVNRIEEESEQLPEAAVEMLIKQSTGSANSFLPSIGGSVNVRRN